jgi:hypothetical protein
LVPLALRRYFGTMDLPEFVRLASERIDRFAWFLGAGASQSAGLPTAWDVMWDLKRRFYCAEENQTVAANDLQNPAVLDKITQFLLARDFPASGDAAEYSRCFELIFGKDLKRQQTYLAAMLADSRASLTQGHRALAALIASGNTKAVFTTNFDGVVEKALAAVGGQSLSPFHLEGSYAVRDRGGVQRPRSERHGCVGRRFDRGEPISTRYFLAHDEGAKAPAGSRCFLEPGPCEGRAG